MLPNAMIDSHTKSTMLRHQMGRNPLLPRTSIGPEGAQNCCSLKNGCGQPPPPAFALAADEDLLISCARHAAASSSIGPDGGCVRCCCWGGCVAVCAPLLPLKSAATASEKEDGIAGSHGNRTCRQTFILSFALRTVKTNERT